MLIPGVVSAQLNTNGSFESSAVDTVSGTDVEGWVIELGGDADAVFQVVDDTVQEGSKALKVTLNAAGSNQWDIQIVADSIHVIPGKTYNYSIWAKSSASGSQVNFTIGNYSYSEYGAIRPANLTTEWKEFTTEFTVSDDQTIIRAPIHFSYAGNVGDTIYIDNLKIYNPDDFITPLVIEAESGEVGNEFDVLSEDSIEYVTIQTNTAAFNPGSKARIITYQVTFPDSGTYDLFVRLRAGSETYNDDSFFYGNGFGVKDSLTDSNWVTMNGMAAAGFNQPNDIVRDAGGLGSQVWKWVNVSRNGYSSGFSTSFFVPLDSLSQTFQIGGREDGLDIDKMVFGKSNLYFTVNNLDNGEPGSTSMPGPIWEGPPLASAQPKFVGNIYSAPQIQNFESYWNQVTPENAGKWGSVEGTRDVMNFSGLDAAYALAKDNDFPFHFHVLVWGAQQPGWINDLTAEEQLEEITEWFDTVAVRYPDIDYLEVANECLPTHNPPDGNNGRANYKEALGGNGESGWDWVLTAFRMAREKFPAGTKLMINDYGILGNTSSTAQYLGLIRLLQSEDLIDIIGVQGHAFSTTAPTVAMKRTLDSLATTGLPIQVTELDVDGPSDDIQLQDYQRIFPALYEHPGVMGITLWGWRPGLWRETAYLINNDGSERPALEWLRTYLDSVDVSVSIEDLDELPFEFELSNNYPNPFNPSTTIAFALPKNGKVRLSVYNVLGQEVAVVLNEQVNAGNHKVTFNGTALSSGLYFYKLVAGENVSVKKMMLLK
ncbi:MAG TPA: T9SS type A sorting domain-containing protein [Caldithrix sp.]|nr:T9SS type A sorting domain-containing protein [Caldithrix sp.]